MFIKINNKLFYLVFGMILLLLIGLVVLFSVQNGYFDLALCKSLVRMQDGSRKSLSFFGYIVEVIGAVPVIFSCLFLLYLFNYYVRVYLTFNPKIRKAIRVLVAILCVFLGIYMMHDVIKSYVLIEQGANPSKWISIFGISLVITIPVSLVINFGAYKIVNLIRLDKDKIVRFITISLLSIIVSFILVYGIKMFFPRIRCRSICLLANGDFDTYFIPWYKSYDYSTLKGMTEGLYISDDFKSFPSGHAFSVSTLLTFVFLPFYFKKCQKKNVALTLFIVPSIFIILILFARVLCGAHFASDVLFGFGIVLLCFVISYSIDLMINRKRMVEDEKY